MIFRQSIGALFLIGFILGCSNDTSISVQPRNDSFGERPVVTNPKIDVLWVVDPSRSMFSEIQTVQNNVDQFVSSFLQKKLDFRMGVITTAAWSALAKNEPGKNFLSNNPFERLHRGGCIGNSQGQEYVTDISAPNPTAFKNLFKPYIDVYGLELDTVACGLEGPPFKQVPDDFPSIDISNGYSADNVFSDAAGRTKAERGQFLSYVNDERPLQSMQAFMNPNAFSGGANQFENLSSTTGAASFFRDEAYLAVIFVSDEADSSRNSLEPKPVAEPDHTVAQYLGYLDEFKKDRDNYSVFSIIDTSLPENLLADLAMASGSTPIDINSNFAADLAQISTNIIEDASFFPMSCAAIPSSIAVSYELDGESVIVPEAPVGYVYNEAKQGIRFTAEHAPPAGAELNLFFQPTSLSCSAGEEGLTIRPLSLTNNTISESASPGTKVGTVKLTNEEDSEGYTYKIEPASSDFDINTGTGEITSLVNLNYEVLNTYRITVIAESSTDELEQDFVIAVTDVSDTTAVAVADDFSVSETLVTEGQTLRGNLSDNDTGLDQVDTHTYTVTDTGTCPTVGLVSGATSSDVEFEFLNTANGSFEFSLVGDINLSVGDSLDIIYRYGVIDPGAGTCNTALVTITVTGENQPPVIAKDGAGNPKPLEDIDASGAVSPIATTTVDPEKITDLAGGGSLADGAPLESTVTTEGHHAIDIELAAVGGARVYEVSEFSLTAPSGYDLGNTVMQMIFDDGASERVLTREVLSVDQGNSVTLNFADKVFANKARLIRPTQSVNVNNRDDLSVSTLQMTARAVDLSCLNIMSFVEDKDSPELPDPLGSERLEFFVADKFSEGAAPAWAFISNSGTLADFRDDRICVRPPDGTDIELSLVARDLAGASLTQIFRVTRNDGGTPTLNKAPVALLQASDVKRGGISFKRYGGRNGGNQSSPFMDYVYAEPGASCSVGPGSSDVDHKELDEFITSPFFPDDPDHLLNADDDTAVGAAAESYDGWSTQCYTFYEPKFTQAAYCAASSSPGSLTPCIISGTNVYGETYTGFFAPTETGVYRFRSSLVDNAVRLLLAPSEYESDLAPVVTGSLDNSTVRQLGRSVDTGVDNTSDWDCDSSQLSSMVSSAGSVFRRYDYSIYGDDPKCDNEFFPGNFGGGHNTQAFYQDIDDPSSNIFEPNYSAANDYKDGWVYLRQGNLYAMQIRFAEGGGEKSFLFSYDYKSVGATSFPGNWKNLDAVSLIPIEGSEAHESTVVSVDSGDVDFYASTLFYDVEFDILEYGARLVNPDGTPSTVTLADINLVLNQTTGQLSGTINNPDNLRVVFSATDPAGSSDTVEYLPLKFE